MNFIYNFLKTQNDLEVALIHEHAKSKEDVEVTKSFTDTGDIVKVFKQNEETLFLIEFAKNKITVYEKSKVKKKTLDFGIPTISRRFF